LFFFILEYYSWSFLSDDFIVANAMFNKTCYYDNTSEKWLSLKCFNFGSFYMFCESPKMEKKTTPDDDSSKIPFIEPKTTKTTKKQFTTIATAENDNSTSSFTFDSQVDGDGKSTSTIAATLIISVVLIIAISFVSYIVYRKSFFQNKLSSFVAHVRLANNNIMTNNQQSNLKTTTSESMTILFNDKSELDDKLNSEL
jgi:uncharacterized protein HemX